MNLLKDFKQRSNMIKFTFSTITLSMEVSG